MVVILFMLGAAGVCCGLVGLALLEAVRRAAGAAPTLRDGLLLPAPAGGWPALCVIVPAHNEERNIGELARSLLAQDYPTLRFVFALDRCTDGTERVLREAVGGDGRVEILVIDRCPDDWAGKTHALWRAVQDSNGARGAGLLLFTDADTIHEPGCARAAVAILDSMGVGLLSALSTLRHERWFERIVQPLCSLELMRHFPVQRVNRAQSPRAFANGQFMLFRRDVYDAVGGHERVRSALLEDISIARRLVKDGARVGVVVSDGVLRCRMYESFAAFVRGWKRIFSEGADRQTASLRSWSAVVGLAMTALPALAALGAALGAWTLREGAGTMSLFERIGATGALHAGVWGLLLWLLGVARAYWAQRAPVLGALLAPVGGALTASILFRAARDLRQGRGAEWGGRVYAQQAKQARPSRAQRRATMPPE